MVRVYFDLFEGVTINTGPEDRAPKDQGPNDLALLHLDFMAEMQLVSMF